MTWTYMGHGWKKLFAFRRNEVIGVHRGNRPVYGTTIIVFGFVFYGYEQ